MLLVGDDAAIEQLDVAIHARGQREIVGDRRHGLTVLVDQFAQDLEYLLAGMRIERPGRLDRARMVNSGSRKWNWNTKPSWVRRV